MAEEKETTNTEVMFNSMDRVLKRLSELTYDINFSRGQRDFVGMLDACVNYFKEICYEMLDEEMKPIWEEIGQLRLLTHPLLPEKFNNVFSRLDLLDISLRQMAKKHGFLTKIKDDPRFATLKQ